MPFVDKLFFVNLTCISFFINLLANIGINFYTSKLFCIFLKTLYFKRRATPRCLFSLRLAFGCSAKGVEHNRREKGRDEVRGM